MKKFILIFAILIAGLISLPVFSQKEKEPLALGLPGDNLNLYAVLDVFQKSRTLEDFERVINERNGNINNLDLNNDNNVDYISVISFRQGNSHSIVLRVAVNSREFQDVAVIEVNKNNAGNISVQIIGDEELYGRDYIVESSDFVTPNPGYTGNRTVIIDWNGGFYVNDWPIMVYLFSPSFSIYISPWRWGLYPVYWRPWAPVNYYNYWNHHNHYYRNNLYRRSVYIRNPDHYSYYYQRRNRSPFVSQNRRSGSYNHTYENRDFRRPQRPFGAAVNPSPRQITPPPRHTTPWRGLVRPSPREAIPSPRELVPPPRPKLPPRGNINRPPRPAFPDPRRGR